MIEYVFRPTRRAGGKKEVSRLFSGRYALNKGDKPVTVPLRTPDKEIARKRLRSIVVEKQRELEGIIAPRPMREAAAAAIASLVEEYAADLRGRNLAEKHRLNTIARLKRAIAGSGWKTLGDVRADSFTRWRATLTCAAKSAKEYQVSVCAFLNWLVRTDRLSVNPIAKVDRIDTRGKQVRPSRAFTEDELKRLFQVADRRLPAYLMLLYTGQRKEEVRALVWGDFHLDPPAPYVLIRESTTKDKERRAVPLHPKLADVFRAMRPQNATATTSVFFGRFPVYESLRADLKRAGIPHRDELGRVVHFHAFRKTWQTMGVRYGINQRAAQELLGHSDPALTAKVYTDVPALGLHSEIAKLPWIPGADTHSQLHSQESGAEGHELSLHVLTPDTDNPAYASVNGELSPFMSSGVAPGQSAKMVVGEGFEPS